MTERVEIGSEATFTVRPKDGHPFHDLRWVLKSISKTDTRLFLTCMHVVDDWVVASNGHTLHAASRKGTALEGIKPGQYIVDVNRSREVKFYRNYGIDRSMPEKTWKYMDLSEGYIPIELDPRIFHADDDLENDRWASAVIATIGLFEDKGLPGGDNARYTYYHQYVEAACLMPAGPSTWKLFRSKEFGNLVIRGGGSAATDGYMAIIMPQRMAFPKLPAKKRSAKK